MMKIILSLFPGIGLLDRAFEEVFDGEACIVRGPDVLWGGDIRTFHVPPGVFWGVIGGPPCQRFSRMANLVRKVHGEDALAENLIPDFERCINEGQPPWFIMENVPEAPLPSVDGYIIHEYVMNNRWSPEAPEQNRVRRFSFGTMDGLKLDIETCALLNPVSCPAFTASGTKWVPVKIGGSGKVKATYTKSGHPTGVHTEEYFRQGVRAQGLPDTFDLPGFTVRGKIRAVGNGVPLPMGRAIAKAVKQAMIP